MRNLDRLRSSFFLLLLLGGSCLGQTGPITFPKGFVPFSSLDYLTFQTSGGYSLLVGEVTTRDAQLQLWNYLNSLPTLSGNEQYVSQPIELAPGMFFNNVLVPTSAERYGDFQDFKGTLYDPFTYAGSDFPSQVAVNYNQNPVSYLPFVANVIPYSRLFEPYAFRLGPGDPSSLVPEPGGFLMIPLGFAAFAAYRWTRQRNAAVL